MVAELYDRLAARSSAAKRKAAAELPLKTGPLLLDAAFLVPRSRSKSFQSLVAREAKSLGRYGYAVTLTGPWPAVLIRAGVDRWPGRKRHGCPLSAERVLDAPESTVLDLLDHLLNKGVMAERGRHARRCRHRSHLPAAVIDPLRSRSRAAAVAPVAAAAQAPPPRRSRRGV